MKRTGKEVLTKTEKRQCTTVKEIREADSIYNQAAPHLLVTAKFPINALTLEIAITNFAIPTRTWKSVWKNALHCIYQTRITPHIFKISGIELLQYL